MATEIKFLGITGARQIASEVQEYVNAHNTSDKSHDDLRTRMNELEQNSENAATNAVSAHNTNEEAHGDIRSLVAGLTQRLNALADSDDTTLDQLSEIVTYIKNNKTLIDGITTGKVNTADIVNNLTTNAANKPLSAAQGVAQKALIDAIATPTKVSQLENDTGFITEDEIGITAITDAEIDEICGTVLDASEVMTDDVTGKQYALYVSNGDLMMTEVS